jgi:hypothetical protein
VYLRVAHVSVPWFNHHLVQEISPPYADWFTDADWIHGSGHLVPASSSQECRPIGFRWNSLFRSLFYYQLETMEDDMGFGRGALLWLLGIPLPIIILLALFWRH